MAAGAKPRCRGGGGGAGVQTQIEDEARGNKATKQVASLMQKQIIRGKITTTVVGYIQLFV